MSPTIMNLEPSSLARIFHQLRGEHGESAVAVRTSERSRPEQYSTYCEDRRSEKAVQTQCFHRVPPKVGEISGLGRQAVFFGIAFAICLSSTGTAAAWNPFQRENRTVAEGNRAYARNDFARARKSYEGAASALPSNAVVHLNRGLALLRLQQFEDAEAAFLTAVGHDANDDVRADAYYNMGLSLFHRAQEEGNDDPNNARRQMLEAADAFRDALRNRPGDRMAAWNYELARQEAERLRQEAENTPPEDPESDQAEDDPSDTDDPADSENAGDSEEPEDQSSPSADQESDQGDRESSPHDNSSSEQQPSPDSPTPESHGESDEASPTADDPTADDPTVDDPAAPPQPSPEQNPGTEPSTQATRRDDHNATLDPDIARVLDAMQANERSLPVEAARARAQGRARPAKDW